MSAEPPIRQMAFLYCIPIFIPMAWPKPIAARTRFSNIGCAVVIVTLLVVPPVLLHYFVRQLNFQTAINGVYCSLLWIYLVKPMRAARPRVANYLEHRQDAFPEALERMEKRQEQGRCQRHTFYDLYLPPVDKQSKQALLFIPGALVDHTAYAVVMSNLSDRGILVAVMNLEPMRLPMRHLGASTKRAKKIMELVEAGTGLADLTWSLGGHSMGGYTASEIVVSLGNTHRLVQWSGGPIARAFASADTPMLSIQASNDKIAGESKPESLPKSVRLVVVDGGNHSGFGHYGPQTFPQVDGKRSIPLEEQQKLAVAATASFLLGKQ